MAQLVLRLQGFVCPIDGTRIGAQQGIQVSARGDSVEFQGPGSHFHLENVSASCQNGHTWRIAECLVERVS